MVKRFCIVLFTVVFFSLASLAVSAQQEEEGKAKVLVTIPPVHSLVASLMKGTDSYPVLLLDRTSSPHSYALRPSDVRKVQEAEIIVMVDEKLEGFLQKVLQGRGDDVLVLSKEKGMKSYSLRDYRDWTKDIEGEKDVHIWLDTDNAKVIVESVAQVLKRKYPEYADIYEKNAQSLIQRLQSLEKWQREQLREVQEVPFMVYHDGWQYFEKQHNLHGIGSVVLDEEILPSVKSRIELSEKIRQNDVQCLFTEPQFGKKAVISLADDFGLRTEEIDTLGLGEPKGEDLYFDLMIKNTEHILKCLGK